MKPICVHLFIATFLGWHRQVHAIIEVASMRLRWDRPGTRRVHHHRHVTSMQTSEPQTQVCGRCTLDTEDTEQCCCVLPRPRGWRVGRLTEEPKSCPSVSQFSSPTTKQTVLGGWGWPTRSVTANMSACCTY